MNRTDTAGRRRLLATWGALVALVVVLGASLGMAARPDVPATSAGDAGAACAGAGEPISGATAKQLRRSVRCLLNDERAIRGRSDLLVDANLQQAAQKHSRRMVETGCLAHRCEGEPDLETRVRRSGYFEGAKAWRFAEDTGCALTAEAMVSNWMARRFHRVNILEKRFRDLGVGVTQRPVRHRCDRGYATFAVVLGWRKAAD